jgi:hypothetical protein
MQIEKENEKHERDKSEKGKKRKEQHASYVYATTISAVCVL